MYLPPACSRRWISLITVCLALIPVATLAGDWPMYRGNAGRTGVTADAGKWAGGDRWIYPTGGPIRTSPAVVGDKVVFGSDDGNVYAVEASSGKLLWQYQTGGPVLSSPAVADGWVFVGGVFGFYQIPVDGGDVKVLFEKDAVDSSPVAEAGRVYFVTRSGVLMGFDYTTGQQILQQSIPQASVLVPTVSSPTLSGDHVFLFAGGQLLVFTLAEYSQQAAKSEPLPIALPGGGAGVAEPVALDDRIFFVGSTDGVVYSITSDGSTVCRPADPGTPLAWPGSTPAVSTGGVAFVTSTGVGAVSLPLDTWSRCEPNVTPVPEQQQTAITPPQKTPSLLVAGDAIFIVLPEGRLIATRLVAGSEPIPLFDEAIGSPIESFPAVSNGFVYVTSTDGNLYAYPIPTT